MNAPFKPSFADLKLYSAFFVIDAPQLGFGGLRYSVGGLAPNKAEAIKWLMRQVEKRNDAVQEENNPLAAGEVMRLDVESVKFGCDQSTIESDKMEALKKLPSGMSAMELCSGTPGMIMNRSLASLLDDQSSTTDWASILV